MRIKECNDYKGHKFEKVKITETNYDTFTGRIEKVVEREQFVCLKCGAIISLGGEK